MISLQATMLPTAAAESITLAWSPRPDAAVTGFKIYYGPASRVYTNSFAVGNVTNATISGLVNGATYFFAATTYDNTGRESTFSDEVVYSIPNLPAPPTPVVTNPTPVITNTVPVVTNPPPMVTNTVPVITNTTPVVTNTPPVVTPPPVVVPPPVIATNTTPGGSDSSALPTLNVITDLSLKPSSALRSVVLTGLGAGKKSSRIVSVTVTSSAPALVSNLAFEMGASGTAGTLVFKTATNALGSAVITVTVRSDAAVNNTFSRSFTVTLSAAAPSSNLRPPTFFRKPANAVAVVGRSVSLSAAATGAGQLKYAWKFNGKTIVGATSPTLTLKKVSTAQAGVYSVTVSSASGSTNSLAALTVFETPAATLGEMTRAANGNFTFPVTGIPGYKYVVQATTDLKAWTSVSTNTSPFVFEDTQTAANEKRFFRAYYDPAL